MKIYNVVQGSPEWHALRARHRCASEAPVMKGASKKTSRTELVRMKAMGDEKVFSEWVIQNLLERGHEVEAQARVIVERRLGLEFFPATIGDDSERFLASYDGITMTDEDAFECKLWNEELAAAVRAGATEFPGGHEWQMEQQFHINPDLKRIHFTVSDGTEEKTLTTVYVRRPGGAAALVAGWNQFDLDVANYVHVEAPVKATPTAKMDLPAIFIDPKIEADEHGGRIAIASSLAAFGDALTLFLKGLPSTPSEDQHFADLEDATKRLKLAEDRLKEAEASALARFTTVDEMRREVARLVETARGERLRIEKLVDSRKVQIRADVLHEGQAAIAKHLSELNKRLGRPLMPGVACDFAAAMKGKKTIAGLRDAVNVTLANAKIEANAIADRIQLNLACLTEETGGLEMLFADLPTLCLKACDDFRLAVRARCADHQAALEKRAREFEALAARALAKPAAPMYPPAEPLKPPQSTGPSPATYDVRVDAAPRIRAPLPPSDDEIVELIADHYEVTEETVHGWLRAMALRLAVAA